MEVSIALDKLKKLVIEEKKQLDNIIRGAELLAEMLMAGEQGGQQATEVEHSEPGLEETPAPRERNTI
jgi:hypothetical protein